MAVRTVDTDGEVQDVVYFSNISPDELLIAFGTGSGLRCIPDRELVATINPRQCAILPILHALTGCDTVSYLVGRGKKTVWKIWKVFPWVIDGFEELLCMPSHGSEESISLLELLAVLMYDQLVASWK